MAQVRIECDCSSNCGNATGANAAHLLECYGVPNDRGNFVSFARLAEIEGYGTEHPTAAGRELMSIYLDTDNHNLESELGKWYDRHFVTTPTGK